VPVSFGELIDKMTILEIKLAHIGDAGKLANVRRELELLGQTWQDAPASRTDIADLRAALHAVNLRLWHIEDDIRDKERAQCFDDGFIRLARAVYIENDERARIKRAINERLGSTLVEEKSYADYGTRPSA
jgi:hypothetical protein